MSNNLILSNRMPCKGRVGCGRIAQWPGLLKYGHIFMNFLLSMVKAPKTITEGFNYGPNNTRAIASMTISVSICQKG